MRSRALLAGLLAVTVGVACGCVKTVREADLFAPPDGRDQLRPGDRIPGPVIVNNRTFPEITSHAIEIEAPDSTWLRGWMVDHEESEGSLIYFYGNDEKVSWKLAELVHLARLGRLDVYCLDYRGYGYSDGSPSADKIRKDAALLYDTVVRQRQESAGPVILFGRSLGSAVAVDVASRRPVDAMILEGTLTSVAENVPRMRKLAPWYARWLLRVRPDDDLLEREQPAEQLGRLTTAVLFLHGEKDELVPIAELRSIYDASPAVVKRWCPVPDAGHFDVLLWRPGVRECVAELLLALKHHGRAKGVGSWPDTRR